MKNGKKISYFCAPIFVHLSYFPTSTSLLDCLVSHILEQLYINLGKIGFNIFLFYFIPKFYTLVFHVSGKVLVKIRSQF